jgi:hypothetical protein
VCFTKRAGTKDLCHVVLCVPYSIGSFRQKTGITEVHVSRLDVAGLNLFKGNTYPTASGVSDKKQALLKCMCHMLVQLGHLSFHYKFSADCLIDKKVLAPRGGWVNTRVAKLIVKFGALR